MPSAIKTVLFLFLLQGCLLRPSVSFAQHEQSAADTATDEGYNSQTDADAETGENEDVTYSDETYNEAHFDKATGAPAVTRRDISDAGWRQMTNDPAFNYEDEPQPEEPGEVKENWWSNMFVSIFNFFRSTFGQGMAVFVVVMILVLLIARSFQLKGNIFFSKKDKKLGAGTAEDEAEYIPDNWEQEIADAARAGNYRLALRFCYRYLLLTLQEKELIRFQAAKTNYQYVYELSGTRFHQPFMKLTRDYEYAWYGGMEIDKAFYDAYYQMTREVQQQLTRQGSFEA